MFLFQILLQSSWQTFAIHKHPNKTYNEVHSRQCGTLKLKAILKLDLYDLNNLHMYKNTEYENPVWNQYNTFFESLRFSHSNY